MKSLKIKGLVSVICMLAICTNMMVSIELKKTQQNLRSETFEMAKKQDAGNNTVAPSINNTLLNNTLVNNTQINNTLINSTIPNSDPNQTQYTKNPEIDPTRQINSDRQFEKVQYVRHISMAGKAALELQNSGE
jgi:hypothetical protein